MSMFKESVQVVKEKDPAIKSTIGVAVPQLLGSYQPPYRAQLL